MPIYESALIMSNIVCGALVLDEKKLYRTDQMIGLLVSALVSIAGVIVIVTKPGQTPTAKAARPEIE